MTDYSALKRDAQDQLAGHEVTCDPVAVQALIAENERLRKVSAELRQWASCDHLHHEPHEQHSDDVFCKVLARIDAAMGKAVQL